MLFTANVYQVVTNLPPSVINFIIDLEKYVGVTILVYSSIIKMYLLCLLQVVLYLPLLNLLQLDLSYLCQ